MLTYFLFVLKTIILNYYFMSCFSVKFLHVACIDSIVYLHCYMVPHCINILKIIHSTVKRLLAYCLSLAILNNAAVRILMCSLYMWIG